MSSLALEGSSIEGEKEAENQIVPADAHLLMELAKDWAAYLNG